ncbi:hypothetical protein [Luteolibacter soli]|uniref:DUF4381 domain-containing protein n=1 Tax=Luteolibacter soli TaxID=3135280 RepID=A0ABU9B1F3_9BACT
MAKESDDALVLRELVPADPLLPDPGMPPWGWVLIGLAAAAVIGFLFFLRRSKHTETDPRHLREEAYARAQHDLEAVPEGGMQAAATKVSLVLRRYLATVCGDPALFETHEEFVSRHAALSGYPEDLRNVTAEGFSHLARLKYGRDTNGDPVALFGAARQLLDRLHQHQPA